MKMFLYLLIGVLLGQITHIYFPNVEPFTRMGIFLLMSVVFLLLVEGISRWMGGRARD